MAHLVLDVSVLSDTFVSRLEGLLWWALLFLFMLDEFSNVFQLLCCDFDGVSLSM